MLRMLIKHTHPTIASIRQLFKKVLQPFDKILAEFEKISSFAEKLRHSIMAALFLRVSALSVFL